MPRNPALYRKPDPEYAAEVRRPAGWDARHYKPVSREDALAQAELAAELCRQAGLAPRPLTRYVVDA